MPAVSEKSASLLKKSPLNRSVIPNQGQNAQNRALGVQNGGSEKDTKDPVNKLTSVTEFALTRFAHIRRRVASRKGLL